MKIKVAIDLSPLYSEHQFRGIGFYTKRLVEVFRKEKNVGIGFEFIKSIEKLRFLEADLIHYPYFTPFFFSLPAKLLAPSIVTIHDLIPIKHMKKFSVGVKGRIRWEIQKSRLKKVKAIITDSQVWKQEINRLTSYPLEKIFSIPLAAGGEFKKLEIGNWKLEIKKKYKLPNTFVLYVGDVNWNKNIAGLLKAFARLRKPNLFLVLVGKAFQEKGLKETGEIRQLIKELNLINQIKFLGFVPTEDLVAVYNLATLYCQPSFDEGFGLPVLEAMACGCPVVAGRSGSLPEICGEAAVLVSPNNIDSIQGGIIEAMGNREKLIEKGLKQAQQFSWKNTARQTINVYKKVVQTK